MNGHLKVTHWLVFFKFKSVLSWIQAENVKGLHNKNDFIKEN